MSLPVPVVSPVVEVEPAAPLTLPEIVVHAPVPVPVVTVPQVEVVISAPAVVTISGDVTQAHCEAALRGLLLDWRWAMALARMESAADGMVGREAVTRTEVHVFRRRLPAARHREAGGLITDGVRGRTNVEVHAWSRRWLSEAVRIDREAAYASCSYGAWQVMGFHHRACGFGTAEGMVAAFDDGIGAQALGLRAFLAASPSLVRAMQRGDWPAVGVQYNGPGNGNQVDGAPNPESHYNRKLRAELVALGVINA